MRTNDYKKSIAYYITKENEKIAQLINFFIRGINFWFNSGYIREYKIGNTELF